MTDAELDKWLDSIGCETTEWFESHTWEEIDAHMKIKYPKWDRDKPYRNLIGAEK